MESLFVIVLIIIVYIGLMFGLSQFIIPNLRKVSPSRNLPQEFARIVDQLNQTVKDDKEFIAVLCKVIAKRYHSTRVKMLLYPRRFFITSTSAMWTTLGTQPCHIWNTLLASGLIYSSRFHEKNIATKHTVVNGCMHQYLRLTFSDGSSLDVDPWGYGIGKVPIGKHARWFI